MMSTLFKSRFAQKVSDHTSYVMNEPNIMNVKKQQAIRIYINLEVYADTGACWPAFVLCIMLHVKV